MNRALPTLALLVAACTDPAPPKSKETPPPFGCPVELTYRDTSSLARVFVAADWNGFSTTTDELIDDGTGTYRKALTLPPGQYAYKFHVTGDGLEAWRVDPANPYRASHAGVENSGLRVADCRKPQLSVRTSSVFGVSGTLRAELAYDAALAGPLGLATGTLSHDFIERPITSEELTVDDGVVRVQLDGLPPGKYTVRVIATSKSGASSDALLLPFWSETQPFTWHDALLYMAVTDRYRNGDPANDGTAPDASLGAGWNGGDLDGVRASIEDGTIPSLGVNALWLTPFVTNPEGTELASDNTHRVSAYHGYWPVDPRSVDPRLGGEAALRRLVQAAHAKGIRVLMDTVVNHVHEQHPYVKAHPEWFNRGCVCGDPGCDWTEKRIECLFRPYLPDVNWMNADAREQFIADALDWVERFDLDGLRVDAVKHVPDLAVRDLAVRARERFETAGARFFLLGETAMGWDPNALPDAGGNVANYDTISRYVGPNDLDGQFDFPLYYSSALAFGSDAPSRGMAHVDFWSRASGSRYPAGAIMTPYLGSHDVSRFVTLFADGARAANQWSDLPAAPASDEPYDRMYAAFGWLLALPGMPLVYMGDEYGDFGGGDPDNRHPWRARETLNERERRQLDRVSLLGRTRRELPGLRSPQWRTLLADDDTLAVARGAGDDRVLALIHRGPQPRSLALDVPAELFAEGTKLTDALDPSASYTVRRAGLAVPMPAWSVRYLRR